MINVSYFYLIIMTNIFIFPRKVFTERFKPLIRHPKFLLLLATVIITHFFPEFGITFKIDLFDLPLERLLPRKSNQVEQLA